MKVTQILHLKNGCILTPVDSPNRDGQYWYGINGRLMNIITRRTADGMFEPMRSYVLAGMDRFEGGGDLFEGDGGPDKWPGPEPDRVPVPGLKDELNPIKSLNLIIERLKGVLNHD